MSEFETQNNDLDNQLNNLLSQLAPDAPPAGFTAKTMAAIRPQVASEPFRIHWTDFVPAFALAVIGGVILFFWLGMAGAHSIFDGGNSVELMGSVSEITLVGVSAVIGLLVVVYPLFFGNGKRSKSWFFSMI